MSSLATTGPRPLQSTLVPAPAQAGGAIAGAQTAPASGKLAARLPVVDPARQLGDSVSISTEALAARAGQLGESTIDFAQRFVDSVAKRLFGNAANDIDFDAASLHTQASFSSSSSSFALSESAHFTATGTIVTKDGQSYDFELEIDYKAVVQSSGTPVDSDPVAIGTPDALTLAGKQLPPIEFPGSLADLFKLLGRELDIAAPANPNRTDGGDKGNLSLRLLRLVNSAALLAPKVRADDPQATPADRSKALANAYREPSSSTEVGVA